LTAVDYFAMKLPTNIESWIDALPEAVKCDVLGSMTVQRYGKGETIFSEGDDCDALYLVESGKVVLSNLSASGKEYIIGPILPGWQFGEVELIDDQPRTYNARAVTDVELKALGKEEFWRLRDRHREIADQLLLFISNRLRLTSAVLASRSLLSLPQQLAMHICYRLHRYSTLTPAGYELTLKLSQEELSNSHGVSRQSVNKALKCLQQAGLIEMHHGRFLVPDRDKLREYSGFN